MGRVGRFVFQVLESIGFVSEFVWRTLVVAAVASFIGAQGYDWNTFSGWVILVMGCFWVGYPALSESVRFARHERVRDLLEKESEGK